MVPSLQPLRQCMSVIPLLPYGTSGTLLACWFALIRTTSLFFLERPRVMTRLFN